MLQEASDLYVEITNNKSCSCNDVLKCGGCCEECQLECKLCKRVGSKK